MSPTIDVLISPQGESWIETHGFTGPACREATQALEAALGLKQSETLTAEYHQPVTEETGLAALPDAPG